MIYRHCGRQHRAINQRSKGVGPKVAGKITLELKDKLKAWQAESASRLALATPYPRRAAREHPGDNWTYNQYPAIGKADRVLLSRWALAARKPLKPGLVLPTDPFSPSIRWP
ncbi:MAG: hypothetical protein R2857_07235 [Vampirovibrionales bacterium]